MRYTVGLKELRRALQSVVVHAVNDPQVEWWHRVRLEVHPQGHVLVYASQGYTAGMAYVGVIDPGDGDLEGFDIAPARVKDLLQLFPLLPLPVIIGIAAGGVERLIKPHQEIAQMIEALIERDQQLGEQALPPQAAVVDAIAIHAFDQLRQPHTQLT